jgi:hypothetical protein
MIRSAKTGAAKLRDMASMPGRATVAALFSASLSAGLSAMRVPPGLLAGSLPVDLKIEMKAARCTHLISDSTETTVRLPHTG